MLLLPCTTPSPEVLNLGIQIQSGQISLGGWEWDFLCFLMFFTPSSVADFLSTWDYTG